MAEDTAVLAAEPSTEVESAPETEPADETTNVEEIAGDELETEAELLTPEREQAIREEAANEAREALRVELEESQAQARYQREITESARYREETGVNALRNFAGWITDQVLEKGATKQEVLQFLNPAVLKSLASGMESSFATEQWVNIGDNFTGYVKANYPEYKPSTEAVDRLTKATTLAKEHPAKAQAMFEARWAFMEDAINHARDERDQKAQQEKTTKAQAVANTQAKDRERAGAGRPMTTTGGSAVPRRMTLDQIEKMPTNEWLAMPKETRDALLARARGG